MKIVPGANFDHYEILASLGAGGMGEVWRARDTRLERDVAIKLLPAEFAKDADRLRRFEQEARATSALNHPNILTVYDTGTHETRPYIVAELLVGEELREEMNQGAIALRKAVDYARQIAEGLAAAQRAGRLRHRHAKADYRSRHDYGHGRLHVARTGAWPGCRSSLGHLQLRCDSLRDAVRPTDLQW